MRALYLTAAAFFVGLATAGLFLPLLPTTPFLLLASWCLVRSSPRLHARLLASPLFGPMILDWERHRGVRLHVKLSALAVLALVVGFGLASERLGLLLKFLLAALATVGATVILRLRTIRSPLPLPPSAAADASREDSAA
jgi:uncharacterized membrane protein YbaN (DUF454 family)